jgi:hypothetical protein
MEANILRVKALLTHIDHNMATLQNERQHFEQVLKELQHDKPSEELHDKPADTQPKNSKQHNEKRDASRGRKQSKVRNSAPQKREYTNQKFVNSMEDQAKQAVYASAKGMKLSSNSKFYERNHPHPYTKSESKADDMCHAFCQRVGHKSDSCRKYASFMSRYNRLTALSACFKCGMSGERGHPTHKCKFHIKCFHCGSEEHSRILCDSEKAWTARRSQW